MKNCKTSKLKIKDNVLVQNFDNESIILNIETGKYFEINNVGKRILSLIKQKEYSKRTLVTELKKHYDSKELDDDVNEFLNRLQDLQILEVS